MSKKMLILCAVASVLMINAIMVVAGVGIYTPMHISSYEIAPKKWIENPDLTPYTHLELSGKKEYISKSESGKHYDQLKTSSPFVGSFTVSDRELDNLDEVEVEISSNGKMIKKLTIDGGNFSKENDGERVHRNFRLDIDPKLVKEFTVISVIKGEKNRKKTEYVIKSEFVTQHHETTHNTRISRRLMFN